MKSALRTVTESIGQSPERTFLTRILIIAGILRLLAVLFFADLRTPQLYEYGDIAQHLIEGKGYSMYFPPLRDLSVGTGEYRFTMLPPPTAFKFPLIVYSEYIVLAIFGKSYGAFLLLHLLYIALSLLTIRTCYSLTRKLFNDEVAARWSAILCAIYPAFILATTTHGGIVWYQAGMMMGMLTIVHAYQQHSARSIAIASVALAIWISLRPETILILLVLLLFFWLNRQWRGGLLVIALALILLVPWQIRNCMTFHSFIPLTTSGWLNFWRGNHLGANGGGWSDDGNSLWATPDILRALKTIPQTPHMELAIDEAYRDAAIAFITANPMNALQLFGKKVLMFWTFDFSDPRDSYWIYRLSYALLFLSAIAGWYVLRARNTDTALLTIPILLFSFIIAAQHVQTRYQIYISALYLPFAGFYFQKVTRTIYFNRDPSNRIR